MDDAELIPMSRRRRSGLGEGFDSEVERMRHRLQKSWHRQKLDQVLDPRSRQALWWDGVVLCALVFTAIVTPVEVAYTERISLKTSGDIVLFSCNRFVDVVFILDMVKHFVLAVRKHPRIRRPISAVLGDRVQKQKHYAKIWLPIDLLSAIPFDLVAMAAASQGESSAVVWRLRLLRMLRLLRLLKLGESPEILKHYQTQHSISFAKVRLFEYVALIFLSAHWMSCVWSMTARLQAKSEFTWVDALAETKNVNGIVVFRKKSVAHRYCRGLYFAVYVLTGLGLGDVVPSTQVECVVAILFIAWGGLCWAYVIGNVCAILSTMDVHDIAFRQRMDELNFYMRDNSLPKDLRERCRMYFYKSKTQQRVSDYAQLERLMSFGLRGEVAAASHGVWLKQVWYLRDSSLAFVAELSQELRVYTFSPTESLDLGPAPTLFIMRSGVAARSGKILSKGAVFGADFIVEPKKYAEDILAVALTYVDTVTLARDSLHAVLSDFPVEADRIRRAIVWYIARALLIARGRRVIAKSRGERDGMRKKKSAVDKLLTGTGRPKKSRFHQKHYRAKVDLRRNMFSNSPERRRRRRHRSPGYYSPSSISLSPPPVSRSSPARKGTRAPSTRPREIVSPTSTLGSVPDDADETKLVYPEDSISSRLTL